MVLNPCWMPQAYVWLCWFICDRSSHQGPNYLFRTPYHLLPGWGLLTALCQSHSRSFSTSPPASLILPDWPEFSHKAHFTHYPFCSEPSMLQAFITQPPLGCLVSLWVFVFTQQKSTSTMHLGTWSFHHGLLSLVSP